MGRCSGGSDPEEPEHWVLTWREWGLDRVITSWICWCRVAGCCRISTVCQMAAGRAILR